MVMRFRVIGFSLAAATTVAGLMVASVPLAAQDVKQGQKVYADQKCQNCHSIAGKGAKTSSLDGVGAKLSAADIREWITDPTGMATKAKSTKKPAMAKKYGSLSAGDLDALVAYLQSLK